jgi:hypothetical protein
MRPSVSPLSGCGILNITQPYRPRRPVTEIALLLITNCPHIVVEEVNASVKFCVILKIMNTGRASLLLSAEHELQHQCEDKEVPVLN